MQRLLILGGGPAGYIAAFEAAKQAKKAGLDLHITLVERTRLGGTCLNVGCIPTKTILKTAHALHDVARAADFAVCGIDPRNAKLDLDVLRSRKEQVIDELVSQIEAGTKRLGIEVVTGTGRLLSDNSPVEAPFKIAVTDDKGEESVHSCDALIIATGSVPIVLPALDAPFIWTSDDALSLSEIPESIIIVGGGVIGVEFAHAYASFGSKVTIVELAKSLLPWFDKRVGRTLARELKAQGIELHLGTSVQSVRQDSGGKGVAALVCGTELRADVIMSAVGRVPNTAGFGFEEAGIEFEGRALAVDTNYETNVPNIYAIGDVIGGLMLAHEAEHEGAIAARKIVQKLSGRQISLSVDMSLSDTGVTPLTSSDTPTSATSDVQRASESILGQVEVNLIPGCIYTTPEIAVIGISADDAKKQGIAAVTGIAKYSANGRALAEGETEGFAQIVAEAHTGQVLGAQIVGAKAVELIAIVTPYMAAHASVVDIADTVFAHPTLSEVIKLAAEVAQSKLKVEN